MHPCCRERTGALPLKRKRTPTKRAQEPNSTPRYSTLNLTQRPVSVRVPGVPVLVDCPLQGVGIDRKHTLEGVHELRLLDRAALRKSREATRFRQNANTSEQVDRSIKTSQGWHGTRAKESRGSEVSARDYRDGGIRHFPPKLWRILYN